MGRLRILFIKNRCKKIARHKARKKNKKTNNNTSKKIDLSNSQLVLKRNNFLYLVREKMGENFDFIYDWTSKSDLKKSYWNS